MELKILIDTEKETIQIGENEPISYISHLEAQKSMEPIQSTNEGVKIKNRGITDAPIKKYKLSDLSLSRLANVHPRLVNVLKEAITNSPYDFSIIQGFRSAEKQQELYKQGRTIKGSIITNCDGYIKKSNHQAKSDGYSYAIDFGIFDKTKDGNIDWDSADKYKAVANHILKIGKKQGLKLVWGGNWTTLVDMPHIELVGVL